MPSRDRSRTGTSRQGFGEVKAWKDLVPVVTNESNGRRADPDLPGKYLSVSISLSPQGAMTYIMRSH